MARGTPGEEGGGAGVPCPPAEKPALSGVSTDEWRADPEIGRSTDATVKRTSDGVTTLILISQEYCAAIDERCFLFSIKDGYAEHDERRSDLSEEESREAAGLFGIVLVCMVLLILYDLATPVKLETVPRHSRPPVYCLWALRQHGGEPLFSDWTLPMDALPRDGLAI